MAQCIIIIIAQNAKIILSVTFLWECHLKVIR